VISEWWAIDQFNAHYLLGIDKIKNS